MLASFITTMTPARVTALARDLAAGEKEKGQIFRVPRAALWGYAEPSLAASFQVRRQEEARVSWPRSGINETRVASSLVPAAAMNGVHSGGDPHWRVMLADPIRATAFPSWSRTPLAAGHCFRPRLEPDTLTVALHVSPAQLQDRFHTLAVSNFVPHNVTTAATTIIMACYRTKVHCQ